MNDLFQWLVGKLGALITWFFNAVSLVGETIIGGLLGGVGAIVPDGYINGFDNVLGGINFFFPLTETIGYAGLYFSLWVLLTVYRLVKSWVPTVSG